MISWLLARRGVKYTEMYLNKNTFDIFKPKYKFSDFKMYLMQIQIHWKVFEIVISNPCSNPFSNSFQIFVNGMYLKAI